MDISNLGSISNGPRGTTKPSSETAEKNQTLSNATEAQVSKEAQTSTVPPVQAPSDLDGKEGSVVTQDNSSSKNIQESVIESESGGQIDLLA